MYFCSVCIFIKHLTYKRKSGCMNYFVDCSLSYLPSNSVRFRLCVCITWSEECLIYCYCSMIFNNCRVYNVPYYTSYPVFQYVLYIESCTYRIENIYKQCIVSLVTCIIRTATSVSVSNFLLGYFSILRRPCSCGIVYFLLHHSGIFHRT